MYKKEILNIAQNESFVQIGVGIQIKPVCIATTGFAVRLSY